MVDFIARPFRKPRFAAWFLCRPSLGGNDWHGQPSSPALAFGPCLVWKLMTHLVGNRWLIITYLGSLFSGNPIQPSEWVRFLRILRHGSRSLFLKIHHHGSEYLESIQRSSVESCRVVFLWVSKLSSGKIEHDHHFPRGGRQCEDSSLDCIVCDGLKYVTPYLDRCNWRSNLVVVVVMMIDDWSWWQVCWWSMTIFLNPPVKSQHLSASSLRARFRPPFWWWNAGGNMVTDKRWPEKHGHYSVQVGYERYTPDQYLGRILPLI